MVNDMTILYGIIVFFVMVGTFVPYFNESFDTDYSEYNPQALEDGFDPDDTDSSVSAFRVISSVVSMFFWSFEVPAWINAIIFMPLRIMLLIIVARNIWIGGGS